MIFTVPILEKSFTSSEGYGKAYKQLTKWLQRNIIVNEQLRDCQYSIVKDEEYKTYKLDLIIYCALDIKEEEKRFCKVCKEMHASFFINENYNCNRCNMKTFMARAKQRTSIKKDFQSQIIKNNSK